MNRSHIEFEEAKTKSGNYGYVYLREMSRQYMGVNNIDINWDQIIEARFFDKASELRFFKYGKELKAVLIEDNGGEEGIDFNTSDKIDLLHDGKFGKSIIVREYFDYDPDGQIFVTASRLVEWR